jgi:hypothetical protein
MRRYRGLGVPLVTRLRYYPAFDRVMCDGVTLNLGKQRVAPKEAPRAPDGRP